MPNYATEIMRVLLQATPEGLPLRKICKHVFNASNSLFNPVTYEDVYADVQAFLVRNSKDESSAIERTSKRGYYRINQDPAIKGQLALEFLPYNEPAEQIENEEAKPDTSLSLFPEF